MNGTLRTFFLAPHVGDFKARQIGVLTGSFLIVIISFLFVRWMGAQSDGSLITIGLVWLALAIVFELSFGHFVFGFSWQHLASDYNLFRGGLLPIGLVVLALSPLIAAKLRAVRTKQEHSA